eukprot:Protomagalhaensia_sp_Gyna_25__2442@NODE_2361_length_1130_cov_21_591201_g1956_i0_p1_GENE_NODE_2361_length_1130_cov_21_591201_g1956_i0NODE_2361_length_1130_cov_21_591201_g1956_i0_p1_ORF_typecomplete_len223_score24_10Ferritin_2/PF13668_6/1_4e14Ferritin_2/PF13668_6/8_9e03MotA_ExbB/PF01618_16/0_089_NODE_2361_length_1130_cov_21_591201_g1956_i064732
MRQQEVAHAARVQYFMGNANPVQPCTYNFDYHNVHEFMRLARTVTAAAEAYYLGMIHLLDDCAAAQGMSSIVVIESIQNALFRTWSGLGVFGGASFGSALTPRQTWTIASPLILACPATNPPVNFTPFPGIQVHLPLGTAAPGSPIQIIPTIPGSFDPHAARYAAFITETGVHGAAFDPVTMTARVPDVRGIVFVALTKGLNSGYELDDLLVVAGPTALAIS